MYDYGYKKRGGVFMRIRGIRKEKSKKYNTKTKLRIFDN